MIENGRIIDRNEENEKELLVARGNSRDYQMPLAVATAGQILRMGERQL